MALSLIIFLNVIYLVSCGVVTEYSKTDEVVRFPAKVAPMKYTFECNHPLEYDFRITCLEGKEVPEHQMMIVSLGEFAVERFTVTSCTKDLIHSSFYLPWTVATVKYGGTRRVYIAYKFFILFVNSEGKCFKRRYEVHPFHFQVTREDVKPVFCPWKFAWGRRYNHFQECTDLQNPAPVQDTGNKKQEGERGVVTDFSRTDQVIKYEVEVKNDQGDVVDLPMKSTVQCTHPIERDFKITCLEGQNNPDYKIMVVSLKDSLVERFEVTSCSKDGIFSSFYLPWALTTYRNIGLYTSYMSYGVFIKFVNTEGKCFKREYEVCPTMEPRDFRQNAKEISCPSYWTRDLKYKHFMDCKNL